MKRQFSNIWIASITIVLSLIGGICFGYFLEQAPTQVHTGLSYGFAAFAVFPIGLCIFGVKELNASFPQIAPYLDAPHRKILSQKIEQRIQEVIVLAFFIIVIQVVGTFYLLYFATEYEKVVLGVLFGGVVSSLIYGLFVCFSVQAMAEKAESIVSEEIGKKRIADYKKKFQYDLRWLL